MPKQYETTVTVESVKIQHAQHSHQGKTVADCSGNGQYFFGQSGINADVLRQITAAAGSVQLLQCFGRGDGADQVADILPLIHDDLRVKAFEDIVCVFLDDAGCQPLTELFMNPFVCERFKRLCFRRFYSQFVIFFRTEIGSDTDAFTVDASAVSKRGGFISTR